MGGWAGGYRRHAPDAQSLVTDRLGGQDYHDFLRSSPREENGAQKRSGSPPLKTAVFRDKIGLSGEACTLLMYLRQGAVTVNMQRAAPRTLGAANEMRG